MKQIKRIIVEMNDGSAYSFTADTLDKLNDLEEIMDAIIALEQTEKNRTYFGDIFGSFGKNKENKGGC
jgi:hypothetical protein